MRVCCLCCMLLVVLLGCRVVDDGTVVLEVGTTCYAVPPSTLRERVTRLEQRLGIETAPPPPPAPCVCCAPP